MKTRYVEPTFATSDGTSTAALQQVIDQVGHGQRVVLLADYGVGKSEALHQAFERRRKAYFKTPDVERFPIHVNLSEYYGLRSPSEILRRHAEIIGFPTPDNLIGAWHAGDCDLLLDGFDELIPSRIIGGANNLQAVRRQALAAVKALIRETPANAGVLISGRSQYFSSTEELRESLGCESATVWELRDFSSKQVEDLVGAVTLPAWLPTRPLLLKFLLEASLIGSLQPSGVAPEQAWLQMFELVAKREAELLPSLTPQVVSQLIARIATVAKSGITEGLISLDGMRQAFRNVCGYEADEEGLQLLQRLPGLTPATLRVGDRETPAEESRRFVDIDLYETAYGRDLVSYISAPYTPGHPLGSGVPWSTAASQLAADIAALSMVNEGYEVGAAVATIKKRLSEGLFDGVLVDVVRAADSIGVDASAEVSPFFSEVLVGTIRLGAEHIIAKSTFKNCFIGVLDVADLDNGDAIPNFDACLIDRIEGWSAIPPYAVSSFANCEISAFSASSQTTAEILKLDRPAEDRVALVILKKLYAQRGSGRKLSALQKGLPSNDRGLVNPAVSALAASGLLTRTSSRGVDQVLPVKDMGPAVKEYLSWPNSFVLRDH